jgi:hypothetical protein
MDTFKIILIVVVLYLLVMFMDSKKEGLENVTEENLVPPPAETNQPLVPEIDQAALAEEEDLANIDGVVAQDNEPLKAEDLLPKYNDADEFAKANPVTDLLKEKNFLIAGHHIGLNTVLQSNKIPYHDIRSAPPVVKENVGPWNQSTYDSGAGSNRRFFEIGSW